MSRVPSVLLAVFLVATTSACDSTSDSPDDSSAAQKQVNETDSPVQRRYVGSDACRDCHSEQYKLWRGSHHYLAMMPAGPESVAGDFAEAGFEYFGTRSDFYARDGAYFVRTDNAQGVSTEFEISHTFGIEPLQQYLVTFPDGRLQAIGIAADTRADDAASWYHLYPDEPIAAGDRLHWTGRDQNWNYMCADCHSTNLHKNYDPGTGRYSTSWSELSVGCEACHGPASEHLTWSAGVTGAASGDYAGLGFASRLDKPAGQIDTCARCHSRRGILAEGFEPGAAFMDHYRPALLDEGVYHPDGQILDEAYEYGSFLQSKMFQKGVRCSDCHDGHAAGRENLDNSTCTRCHQSAPPTDYPSLRTKTYDSTTHHFHAEGTPGAQCIACHMPTKLYMGIDERHDHSLRVPRPDVSVEINVPNACNGCHTDKDAEWAAAQIRRRYPTRPPPFYGTVLAAGRRVVPAAGDALAAVATDTGQAVMVRASALALLANYHTATSRKAIVAGLGDADPLLRLGALRGMQGVPLDRR